MNLVHQLMRRGGAVIAGVGLAGSMVAFTGTAYAVDHHAAPQASAHGQAAHHGKADAPAGTGGSGTSEAPADVAGTPSSPGSAGSAVDAAAASGATAVDSTAPAEVCAEGVMRIERDGSQLIEHADCSVETVPAGTGSASPGRTVTSGPVGPAQPMSGDAVFGERVQASSPAPAASVGVAAAPAAATAATPSAAKAPVGKKAAVKSAAKSAATDPQPGSSGAQVLGETVTRVPVIVDHAPGDPLPLTGKNVAGLAATGIATIGFGLAVFVLGRRRKAVVLNQPEVAASR
jgi:LPXTG-motif cell wall-anchored protein